VTNLRRLSRFLDSSDIFFSLNNIVKYSDLKVLKIACRERNPRWVEVCPGDGLFPHPGRVPTPDGETLRLSK
jgi:hypothetical protein